ncbi:hypothetical protein SAMN04487936_10435 [Halobacillus dabanensis]|uniref:Uncharacterized protein n=1 Tax=Halobacillus dabanensis TaxID=240302 RepID=A0A1I3TUP8_HALDA|nr:hypothetical protein [Halobacillus dabanensis]SFJ74998.1 hypothetical protein SAMN04487936_10435 [Halobacillus dabanensis]
MKENIIQLEQKLIYYRAELDKYKRKVEDYQDNYHYSQLEKLKIENAELLDQIEQSNNQESVLKGELSRRVQGFDEQVEQYEEQEEKYKNEIKDWQDRFNEVERKNEELTGQIHDLDGGLKETRRRFSQSQRDLSMLQRSYAEIQKRLLTETEARMKAVQEVEKLNSTMADTKKSFSLELEDLEDQRNQLKEALDQKEQMLLQYKKDFTFLQNTFNNERKARIQEEELKEKALKECQTIRGTFSKKEEKYLEDLEHSKNKCVDLEKQSEVLLQRFREIEKELSETNERLARTDTALSELQSTYQEEKSEHEAFKKEAEQTVHGLKKDYQSLKDEREKLKTSNSQYQTEQNRLRTEMKKIASESGEKREENEKLKKELAAFQSPPYLEQIGEGEFFSQMVEHMKYLFGESVECTDNNEGKVAFMKVLEKKLEELTTDLEESHQEKD